MARDERPEESTFADVLNGLTMGGRPRGEQRPAPRPHGHAPPPPAVAVPEEEPPEENAASVRAYAWTAGRTRTSTRLEIETLISTTSKAEDLFDTMRLEHQAVARLCRQSRSVAEIGALLTLPIGVVRVLLDDMANLGLVTVHRSQTTGTGQPDMDLLRRVLRGLTNLRA